MGKKIITIILLLGIFLNSRVLFVYAENENTADSTESGSMLEKTEDLEDVYKRQSIGGDTSDEYKWGDDHTKRFQIILS